MAKIQKIEVLSTVVDDPSDPAHDINGVLDMIGEMAQITASFARDHDQDAQTRVGAAVATATIISKATPALRIRDELVAKERNIAARRLGYRSTSGGDDPFGPIRRAEAINTLKRHRQRVIGKDDG